MRQTRIATLLFVFSLLILLSACGDQRLYKEAQESFEKGDYSKAKTATTTLINNYPKSKYASLAQEILQKIDLREAEEQKKRVEERLKQLIEALNNRETRRDAIKELGELGDKRAVESLIDALKYEKTKKDVIEALGKIGDERAVETLIAIIKDKEEYSGHTEAAVIALAEIDNKYIIPFIELIAIPRDDSYFSYPRLRLNSKIIKNIGEPAVEPLIAILQKLKSKRWKAATGIRGQVIGILGGIGDKRAVEPLIVALKRENEDKKILWRERQYIANALGNMGDEQAVAPLIEALISVNKAHGGYMGRSAEEDAAMDEIVGSLEKITNQDFGIDPNKWKEWLEKNKK